MMCAMGVLLIVRPPLLFLWASEWIEVGQGDYVIDYNGYFDIFLGTNLIHIIFFSNIN